VRETSSKAKAKLVRFESEPSCAPLLIKAAVVAQDPSSMPSPGCTAPAGGGDPHAGPPRTSGAVLCRHSPQAG
jgi:hypothetical protein